jgi:hypothetical protein
MPRKPVSADGCHRPHKTTQVVELGLVAFNSYLMALPPAPDPVDVRASPDPPYVALRVNRIVRTPQTRGFGGNPPTQGASVIWRSIGVIEEMMAIRAGVWGADRSSPLVKFLRAGLHNLVEIEDSAPVAAVISVGPRGSVPAPLLTYGDGRQT